MKKYSRRNLLKNTTRIMILVHDNQRITLLKISENQKEFFFFFFCGWFTCLWIFVHLILCLCACIPMFVFTHSYMRMRIDSHVFAQVLMLASNVLIVCRMSNTIHHRNKLKKNKKWKLKKKRQEISRLFNPLKSRPLQ